MVGASNLHQDKLVTHADVKCGNDAPARNETLEKKACWLVLQVLALQLVAGCAQKARRMDTTQPPVQYVTPSMITVGSRLTTWTILSIGDVPLPTGNPPINSLAPRCG